MDITKFKEVISGMTNETDIKSFIDDRYVYLKGLLIKNYHATFCDGINEDQFDNPPSNIEPSVLNEFYIFSDLRRLFILDRNLGLEKNYEELLNPYRQEVKARFQEINQ